MLFTVDIGTTNFKSAVWDFSGNRKAFHAVSLVVLSDGKSYHEADSRLWLSAFADCCTVIGKSVPLTAVEAVVISGNGPSLVPVLGNVDAAKGDYCFPAAPARLWSDRRAVEAARQVSSYIGSFVDAGFFLPKILDIKINEPYLYEKTGHFLGCPEFLAFALTGEARTVFPSNGFERWYWNDSVLEYFNLDKEKIPVFICPGEIFGVISNNNAARFGFKPGTPVIAGGPDFFAAILGSGTVKPGQVCDRAGTSEGINACTENRIIDQRLMSYGHPVKPFWNLSGIISTAGKAIEWACGILGVQTYDEYFTLAENSRAGAGGAVFLPYLAGERAPVWNQAARGEMRGLSLSTGRAEFARSVLEGICFAIRDTVSVMEEAGAETKDMHIAGRLSGNKLLNRLKADITKKSVVTFIHKESELLGLAVIGACILGKYASFSEAAGALVRIEETILPDEKNAALYDDLFAEYMKMREEWVPDTFIKENVT